MYRLHLKAAIFFLIALFYPSTNAQEWIKTETNPGDDRVTASATDIQGNLYITGYITDTSGGKNYCTKKYNRSGQLLWTAEYNGTANGDDHAFGIAVDRLGTKVYVTGSSASPGNNIDIATVLFSASTGEQLASIRYGDPSNMEDRACGIVVDITGSVYITGFITRPDIGRDIYTAKYDQGLNLLWHRSALGAGSGDDRAFGIITDSLGSNIYVTGSAVGSNSGSDIITICYDSGGSQKWLKIYNGPGNSEDGAFGIAIDNCYGGVYVTGYSTNGNSASDYTTIKYNPKNGQQMWVKLQNGSGNGIDKAFGIAVDNSGNSYVTGMSEGFDSGGDYLTVKYDTDGEVLWQDRFSGSGKNNDSASSIVYSKGYIYVTGYSYSSAGKEDILTIKYNSTSGDSVQSSRINMPSNMTDVGVKVAADTTGHVYVTGYSYSPGTDFDWLTMKYYRGSLVIGIERIPSEVPQGFELHQNYPNPFNPETKIRFELPASKDGKLDVSLKVYNILGRQVAVLVNEKLSSGIYEADWDASMLPSGIYFYKITAGSFTNTKRMTLIK